MSEQNTEQTITYDDFELSLQHDGVEIIIPDVEEEVKGIGAAGFTPKYTAPSYTNPYYLKYGYGGYNRCILISGNSCLPNCVGFAHGRLLESCNVKGDTKLPTCNAEDWIAVAKANGLTTSSTPKAGSVIVWRSGNLWNSSDGCGHVGFVEEIQSDGTLVVSQSNYGGTRFFITKHTAPYNIYGQTCIGFVLNPYLKGKNMWKKDEGGWWYEHADGSYPTNKWEEIDGKWYHFNAKGYMQTGWITVDGTKYYLGDDGVMRKSQWIEYGGSWYFVGKNGEMFVGYHNVPVNFDKNGKFIGYTK